MLLQPFLLTVVIKGQLERGFVCGGTEREGNLNSGGRHPFVCGDRKDFFAQWVLLLMFKVCSPCR